MVAFLWVLAACEALTVIFWWAVLLSHRRVKMKDLALTPLAEWPKDRPAPSLAVVVACHNEEKGIEACIRRLEQQNYPNLQIVVANDRSTDRTQEILARLAEENPQIRIVEITHLPADWTGKTHAVSVAVAQSESDYILFMDSDVELAPNAIITVMGKACSDNLDFLSFWPYLDLRSFPERLLVPPALMLLTLWASPTGSKKKITEQTIMGNGQFMLVKRSSYDAIGGHRSVGAELAEDAVLAAKAHVAGQRCWSGPSNGLYLTYREGNFSRTVNSLARVLIGSLQSQLRLLASTQVMIGGGFPPVWLLPTAAICLGLGFDRTLSLVFLILAALHWMGIVLSLHRAFAATLVERRSLIWFPIGSVIVAGVLFWCSYLFAGLGTIRWGATRYRVKGSQIAAISGG
jgi:chlorobactene glucosyltransferase